jgi:hypothetical protein
LGIGGLGSDSLNGFVDNFRHGDQPVQFAIGIDGLNGVIAIKGSLPVEDSVREQRVGAPEYSPREAQRKRASISFRKLTMPAAY